MNVTMRLEAGVTTKNFDRFQPECQDAPRLYFIKASEYDQVAVFSFHSCQLLLMHYGIRVTTLYSF